jgi:hypothetical protein
MHEETIDYYKKFDKFFTSFVSVEAWSMITLQILKIYLFGTISWKQFKALPGVSIGDEKNSLLHMVQGSNMYSVSESILLAWVSHHWSKVLLTS